jgi:hypothetical protein
MSPSVATVRQSPYDAAMLERSLNHDCFVRVSR